MEEQLLDSRLLLEMLRMISSEISYKTLPYLLMANDNVVSCLLHGNNNTGEAYWPRSADWKKNAQRNFSTYTTDEYIKDAGIDKLAACCRYYRNSNDIDSLEDQFMRLLDEIYVTYYDDDVTLTKSEIVRILTELHAPAEDISHIESIGSLKQLSIFLVNRAKAKGRPSLKKKSGRKKQENTIQVEPPLPLATNSTNNTTSIAEENTVNKSEIIPCTYFDLRKKGLTALDISAQLMANDAALYGSDLLGVNAGKTEQWSEQIVAAPDNWFFFCKGTDIIGNWSITYLSPQEEASVRRGTFAGDDFSLDSVNYPLTSPDKDVVIYILNISLNDGYQTQKNWDLLWKSFGTRLKRLIESGITVSRIYSDLFRDDHKKMFKNMGFKYLVDNVVSGQVFCLDLATTPVEKFDWIIPESILSSDDSSDLGQSITFLQLSHDEALDKQQLADIAGLIFDTDKYIYPPLFSRRQARIILPMLFDSNTDSMFNLDNIFCAITERNRIVGLILHKHGPLKWNADNLLEFAQILDEDLPDTVRTVEERYFRCYDEIQEDTTAILNCCVNSNYRMRSEIRLGTHMMQAFMEQHPERLELYVLKETPAAMRLYLRAGFKTSEKHKCNGFSIDNRSLPCYFMYRPAKAK